jgi:hypothetical protein
MSDGPGGYIPPQPGAATERSWDPGGPDGQLTDAHSPYGHTIGQIAGGENPPGHGWMRGPDNTVIPDTFASGPPPGALAAQAAQMREEEEAVALLLLF